MKDTIKEVRRIIIMLLIIIVLIIITIKVLKNNNIDLVNTIISPFVNQEDDEDEKQYDTIEVENKVTYYAVKRIIGKYADYIALKNTDALYNILEKRYFTSKRITKENVLENIDNMDVYIIRAEGEDTENINENSSGKYSIQINIDKMYQKQEESTDIFSFIVYGSFEYTNSNAEDSKQDFSIIVEMDTLNGTYYIIPTNEVSKKYAKVEQFAKYEADKQEIQENKYNTFSFQVPNDSTVINDHVMKYKNALANNIEEAYNLLDEEYREKRFQTLENYKKYVEENKKNILSFTVYEYIKETDENVTRYICRDKLDNYFIFEETVYMNFKLKLDTHTIDTAKFIETYAAGTKETRVSMNVEKWISMINCKDYKAAYEVLDETFRNENFSSLEKFEEYMRYRYPSRYDITDEEIKENSGMYVASIRLIQKTEDNRTLDLPIYNMNIIMQPGSDRNFVMSFSINQH